MKSLNNKKIDTENGGFRLRYLYNRNEDKINFVAISIACVLAVFLLYRYTPGKSPVFPPCPFRYLSGLYCPGCGTLRALHALLHGRFLSALDLNPLMIISLPFIGYAFISYGLLAFGGAGLPCPKFAHSPAFALFVLILIVAYWLLRNIPIFPLTYLAP